ncbi:MAG TPA: PAS domain-containing protein [Rhodanobacteraceae bacterium]|nr:PAS domain-containing protein [Rhodanobacteraceae bacterium]
MGTCDDVATVVAPASADPAVAPPPAQAPLGQDRPPETTTPGYCLLEKIGDQPLEFAVVEANSAFRAQLRIGDVAGSRTGAWAPAEDGDWLLAYDGVLRSGAPCRFELPLASRGRVLEQQVCRIGQRLLAVLSTDVTDRKHAEARQAEDAAAIARIQALGARRLDDTPAGLDALRADLLAAAVELTGAAKGAVFRLEDGGEALRLLAHHGLGTAFVAHFSAAPANALWAPLVQRGGAVAIEDVVVAPELRGSADRHVLLAEGIRACHCTPLLARDGRLLGQLQVCFPQPHALPPRMLPLIDLLARQLADLLEREQLRAALQRSEERLHVTLKGGGLGAWSWDLDSNVVSWSAGLEELHGLRAGEFDGSYESYLAAIHPEDRERLQACIDHAMATGEPYDIEHRWIRRDGRVIWIEGKGQVVRDAGGRPLRMAGVCMDISARKQAEQALRESERRQRALIEGIPQLVWRATGVGECTWVSRQWVEYTGLSHDASLGLGWLDALHPDDRASTGVAWRKAQDTGVLDTEFRIFNAREKRCRWFQTRAHRVRSIDGRATEWLGTCTEVDELRRLQDRQRVLVAELQHRTRNLLSVIHAMADKTLRASGSLQEFQDKFGDRLGALARVQGLLSRLRDGDRIAFDELVRTELSAHAALETDARIVLDGPRGVALRSASVQTLAMALHELATNAVKYGALKQPRGRLTVRWRLQTSGEDGKPWLHVDWIESDVVMPAAARPQPGGGSGRTLIEEGLPYQLDARTSYRLGRDGVHCSIALAVPHVLGTI